MKASYSLLKVSLLLKGFTLVGEEYTLFVQGFTLVVEGFTLFSSGSILKDESLALVGTGSSRNWTWYCFAPCHVGLLHVVMDYNTFADSSRPSGNWQGPYSEEIFYPLI